MKLSKEFIREMIKATISEEDLGLGIDEPEPPAAEEIQRQNVAALEQMVAELEGIRDQVMDMGSMLRGINAELAGEEMNITVSVDEMVEKIDEALKGMQKLNMKKLNKELLVEMINEFISMGDTGYNGAPVISNEPVADVRNYDPDNKLVDFDEQSERIIGLLNDLTKSIRGEFVVLLIMFLPPLMRRSGMITWI